MGMREVVVEKYEIGKEVKLPMEPVIGCTCTCRDTKTRYSLSFWSIIRLCRRDGRAVQGVALELLCRLLFTEGSNPSLSVSVNSPTLPTTMYQIK